MRLKMIRRARLSTLPTIARSWAGKRAWAQFDGLRLPAGPCITFARLTRAGARSLSVTTSAASLVARAAPQLQPMTMSVTFDDLHDSVQLGWQYLFAGQIYHETAHLERATETINM